MKKKSILVVLVLLLLCGISACGEEGTDYSNYAPAVFHLEGGVCKNNTDKVTYLYDLSNISETYIADPNVIANREIISRPGYTLKGWYRQKNTDGSYSEPWDFSKDKIDSNGVELYAWWDKNVAFTYDIFYLDENNQEISLGSYKVSKGAKFNDYLDYSKRRNYTCIGYKDENGMPWDDNFQHPGGDSSVSIKLYAQYIEGEYSVVKTASDLKSSKGKAIYLLDDIDLNGAEFSFNNYKEEFIGNGHTISNLTVAYDGGKGGVNSDGELIIALFNGQTKGATIEDVTFENIKVNIATTFSLIKTIQVSPIANAVDSNFSNLKISGDVVIEEGTRPMVRPGEEAIDYTIIVEADELCFVQTNCKINGCEVALNVTDNRS